MPGYVALKLAAWLDRSVNGGYKDAADIATAMYWYAKSADVETFLYETDRGQGLLIQEEYDPEAAAIRVLGEDVADVVGRTRVSDLARRWPNSRKDLLYQYMTMPQAGGWPRSLARRQELVRAIELGVFRDHRGGG